jgi:CRISPR-associated exonuclease Cas4
MVVGSVVSSDSVGQPDGADLADPIPISALQHAVYCLRQAALIHIERVWAENRFTAEGRVLHDVTHEAGARREHGIRRVTGRPVISSRHNAWAHS